MHWKLSQSFIGEADIKKVKEEDFISALSFDRTGDFVALGDKNGRVIVFENELGLNSMHSFNLKYSNEFQSHNPETDILK